MIADLRSKFKSAEKKVSRYLKKHGFVLSKCIILFNDELEEECIADKGYPNRILVSHKNVAESAIAHQLVNIAQDKLITPVNIKYLYSLIAEGLSDYVIDKLYSRYEVINSEGYKLIELLNFPDDEEDTIKDLFDLSNIKVEDIMVDRIMQSEKVNDYFKRLIKPRLDMIKTSLQAIDELDIGRPNYVPFGEEFKSWIFITNPRFNPKWEQIEKILTKYYGKDN